MIDIKPLIGEHVNFIFVSEAGSGKSEIALNFAHWLKAIGDKPVHVQGLDTFLDRDENHYGLAGSATQVERIFPPENNTVHEVWQEGNNAERLRDVLKKWKFI